MTDPDFLQLPPMTILETARLRLRTVRVSDAASLLPIITDKTTMKFTSGVVANDREVAERWLSARALGRDVLNFVITLKNGEEGGEVEGKDERIGKEVVGIMGSYHWPEVGYLMHPGKFVLVLALIDVELLQECYPFDRFYASINFQLTTEYKQTILTSQPLTSPRRQRIRNRSPSRLHLTLLLPSPLSFLLNNINNIKPHPRIRLPPSRNRHRKHQQPKSPPQNRFHARRDSSK
jgi:hypothetical protein